MSSSADDLDRVDESRPVFVISVAARLAGMHPQTLRTYDRMGLVVPRRAKGQGRRYSWSDVRRLRLIQQLSQSEGVNLPGIQRILQMQMEIDSLRRQVDTLTTVVRQFHALPRLFAVDHFGQASLDDDLLGKAEFESPGTESGHLDENTN